MTDEVLRKAAEEITPCCRRNKPLWIGIGLTAIMCTLVVLLIFNKLTFITINVPSAAMIWFYLHYFFGFVGITVTGIGAYFTIKEYCKLVKERLKPVDLLTIACFLIFANIVIMALMIDWASANYVDALFYSLDDKQRTEMIKNIDCSIYLKFYDEKENGYVFNDLLSEEGIPKHVYHVERDC